MLFSIQQDINQDVIVICFDGREIAGRVVSIGDAGNSLTLVHDGERIELSESEVEEIWVVPIEDTYVVISESPVQIAGFYKHKISQRMWNVETAEQIMGPVLFTFDRKKIYNYWSDYPHELTPEEIEIFEADNPYWANFSKERKMKAEEILKKNNGQ